MSRKQSQKRQRARLQQSETGAPYSHRTLARRRALERDGDEEPRDRYFRRDLRAKS